MDNNFLFSEVSTKSLDYVSKSKISDINLHTSLWSLFNLYSNESKEYNDLFNKAKNILDNEIRPDELFIIMANYISNYNFDLNNVEQYARILLSWRK
jgi:hypothetical protein